MHIIIYIYIYIYIHISNISEVAGGIRWPGRCGASLGFLGALNQLSHFGEFPSEPLRSVLIGEFGEPGF